MQIKKNLIHCQSTILLKHSQTGPTAHITVLTPKPSACQTTTKSWLISYGKGLLPGWHDTVARGMRHCHLGKMALLPWRQSTVT